jgi:hypothetical protein
MKARTFRKAGQERRMTRAMQDRADIPADHRLDFDYRADARMHSDPWSLLHELGAGPGFFFSPQLGGHWCAVKRGIVIDILRNWELFSCRSIRVPRVERSVEKIPDAARTEGAAVAMGFDPRTHRTGRACLI